MTKEVSNKIKWDNAVWAARFDEGLLKEHGAKEATVRLVALAHATQGVDFDTLRVWFSLETVATLTGLSEKQVRRARKVLVAMGALVEDGYYVVPGGRGKRTRRFYLNLDSLKDGDKVSGSSDEVAAEESDEVSGSSGELAWGTDKVFSASNEATVETDNVPGPASEVVQEADNMSSASSELGWGTDNGSDSSNEADARGADNIPSDLSELAWDNDYASVSSNEAAKGADIVAEGTDRLAEGPDVMPDNKNDNISITIEEECGGALAPQTRGTDEPRINPLDGKPFMAARGGRGSDDSSNEKAIERKRLDNYGHKSVELGLRGHFNLYCIPLVNQGASAEDAIRSFWAASKPVGQ